MIAITILAKEEIHLEDIPDAWSCWLELTDGQDILYLPATAPIDTKDLTAHFQARADRLWTIAERKHYTYEGLPQSILIGNRLTTLGEQVNALKDLLSSSSI